LEKHGEGEDASNESAEEKNRSDDIIKLMEGLRYVYQSLGRIIIIIGEPGSGGMVGTGGWALISLRPGGGHYILSQYS
jgi:hypothetical protein